MDTGVGDEVGLKLCQIHIQGSAESERGCHGRDDLGHKAVQVSVGWSLNVQVTTTNVVNGFVVDHEHVVRIVSECSKVVWVVRIVL